VIEDIILQKKDVKYIVNKFMTTCCYFQKEVKHLTQQIRNSEGMVDFIKRQEDKDTEDRLKEELRLLKRSASAKS